MEDEPLKADPPKRKRHLFQFSLRTLLIGVALLAVVCGYVAWRARVVSERERILTQLEEQGASFVRPGEYVVLHNPMNWEIYLDDSKVSPLGRLLGDAYVARVSAPYETTPEQMDRFRATFPEATVIRWPSLARR